MVGLWFVVVKHLGAGGSQQGNQCIMLFLCGQQVGASGVVPGCWIVDREGDIRSLHQDRSEWSYHALATKCLVHASLPFKLCLIAVNTAAHRTRSPSDTTAGQRAGPRTYAQSRASPALTPLPARAH